VECDHSATVERVHGGLTRRSGGRRSTIPAVVCALALTTAGCAGSGEAGATSSAPSAVVSSPVDESMRAVEDRGEATPGPEADGSGRGTAETTSQSEAATVLSSAGEPRRARLSIPALDIDGVVVVPYRGTTDDAPGTAIQNRGRTASPHGPRGGVGPGGIGNYLVTGHRLSSTQVFLSLPELRPGQRVRVLVGRTTYVYEITRTRRTSFRSPASLRAQRAAVPGRPGAEPRRAMITLSTCATPEDRAAGNFWSDEFGNPEHRIDKIGVLRAIRR